MWIDLLVDWIYCEIAFVEQGIKLFGLILTELIFLKNLNVVSQRGLEVSLQSLAEHIVLVYIYERLI